MNKKGTLCRRAPDNVIEIIMNSDESAAAIGKKVGLSATSVRRYRIENGYNIYHMGCSINSDYYKKQIKQKYPDREFK